MAPFITTRVHTRHEYTNSALVADSGRRKLCNTCQLTRLGNKRKSNTLRQRRDETRRADLSVIGPEEGNAYACRISSTAVLTGLNVESRCSVWINTAVLIVMRPWLLPKRPGPSSLLHQLQLSLSLNEMLQSIHH